MTAIIRPTDDAAGKFMSADGTRPSRRRARFWDKIAEKYAKQPVADEASYQEKLRVSQSYFTPETEALEIACGTGATAVAHAPHVKRYRATDISENMLAIGRRRAAEAGADNVTFEQAAIEDLVVAEESLDAVLAMSILHLLKDERAAISRIHGWLKPGGVFITSTACLADYMGWFRPIATLGRIAGAIPYVKFLTQTDLRRSLEAAGFEIDHEWRPAKNKAVFIVARKPAPLTKT